MRQAIKAFLSILLLTPALACASPFSFDALTIAAPTLSPAVALRAEEAMDCAAKNGQVAKKLIVVDMSLNAKNKRLWAFDTANPDKPKLILSDWVAHGAGSDTNRDGIADQFSNKANSLMTSLGLYRVAERYKGKSGWSRRLDGLFGRFNSNARGRAVVMHASRYVTPGRVGRSHGCPAIRQEALDALEAAGIADAVLWIDGPDKGLEEQLALCAGKSKISPFNFGQMAANTPEPPTLAMSEPTLRLSLPGIDWPSDESFTPEISSLASAALPLPSREQHQTKIEPDAMVFAARGEAARQEISPALDPVKLSASPKAAESVRADRGLRARSSWKEVRMRRTGYRPQRERSLANRRRLLGPMI